MSLQEYKIIPNTDNMLLKLIDNINSDDTFQKEVIILENGDEKDSAKAGRLKYTMKNIKVYNNTLKPLFLAKDIGILMGISDINRFNKMLDDDEKVKGYINNGLKTKKEIFLTRSGLYRAIYTSKSPFSKVFRKFINILIDHMIENETKTVKILSDKFKIENKQLIDDGRIDLEKKIQNYVLLNEKEKEKNRLLKQALDDEYNRRLDIEADKTVVEVENNFVHMHVEQLKQENKNFLDKIKSININSLEDNSSKELLKIKNRYMKKIQIYAIDPDYLVKIINNKDVKKDIIKNKKRENSIDTDTDDDNTHSNIEKTSDVFNKMVWLDDIDLYKRNFLIDVDVDEILFIVIYLKKILSKSSNLKYIGTTYVFDKKYYELLHDDLIQNCDYLKCSKFTIYRTSINEINDLISDAFVNKTD